MTRCGRPWRCSLQQTPFLTLLPDQRIQRTLRLMQQQPDTAVTAEVAREVCQRAGARATVEGSIAQLGLELCDRPQRAQLPDG